MTVPTIPLADALQALVDSGCHEQAAQLAIRHATPPPNAITAPIDNGERDYLTIQELRKLSREEVHHLRTKRPDGYVKSLQMLAEPEPVKR